MKPSPDVDTLRRLLIASNGNVAATARDAGMNYNTLRAQLVSGRHRKLWADVREQLGYGPPSPEKLAEPEVREGRKRRRAE